MYEVHIIHSQIADEGYNLAIAWMTAIATFLVV